MPHPYMTPTVLVSVPNEVEAALIVGALEAEGVQAQMTGGYTAAFRAEAPGQVQVLVDAADVPRARAILATIPEAAERIDWDLVDLTEEVEPESEPAASQVKPRNPNQFSLAAILAVQAVVAFLLGLAKGLPAETFISLVLFVVAVVLAASGSVGVAADLERTRHIWRRFFRPTLIVAIAVQLVVLLRTLLS